MNDFLKDVSEIARAAAHGGRPCLMSSFLTGRADALEIFDVIHSKEHPVPAVYTALKNRGFAGAPGTVHFHRNRMCQTCKRLEALLRAKKRPARG